MLKSACILFSSYFLFVYESVLTVNKIILKMSVKCELYIQDHFLMSNLNKIYKKKDYSNILSVVGI